MIANTKIFLGGVAVAYFLFRAEKKVDSIQQLFGGQTGASTGASNGGPSSDLSNTGIETFLVDGQELTASELINMGYAIVYRDLFPLAFDFLKGTAEVSLFGGQFSTESGEIEIVPFDTLSIQEYLNFENCYPCSQNLGTWKWNSWVKVDVIGELIDLEIDQGGDPGQAISLDSILSSLINFP